MENQPSPSSKLMLTRRHATFMAATLIAGLLFVAPSQAARAQSTSSCEQVVEYLDLDADGQAEAMALACHFTPTTNDSLTIYRQSGQVLTDIPWRQNIAYENETWIFDHGTRGKASLIVDFTRDGSSLVAELYDDRNGDAEVRYQLDGANVKITESQYWTVRVVAPDGWWIQEDDLNYNLHILVDGDVEAMFAMGTYRSNLATDGQPDCDIQTYDQNHNGSPEYDKRMILTPFLLGSVGLGTQMMANWADDELPISGGFDLWPYLQLGYEWPGGSTVVKGYLDTPAPLQFEPATGRIEAVGEFVASRGGEHNCFYYSAKPWIAGQLNESDNENPFCFYDLAGDADGIPELQIRFVYWPPKDRAFLGGSVSEPYGLIRYSWDQDNSQTWRYAIGLVGRNQVESRVAFTDLEVLTIPYSELPTWVTDHTWDMAVFSEFTGRSYFTSEGNYSVSYPEDWEFGNYFLGRSDEVPSPEYEPEAGFRMEWAMDYASQPYLYFSPVDRRLHLLGATGGTWTIDESQSIRYENLGGGQFLNHWVYLVDGQPQKSLAVLSDFIMLSENGRVTIRPLGTPEAQFITLPPRDHEEWLALGQKLSLQQRDYEAADFSSMLAQFEGPTTEIEGAALRDLRPTAEGFRFIMELQPGFAIVSDPEGWGSSLTAAGAYAVSFDGAAWDVRPATPAVLEADVPIVGEPGRPARALEWTSLSTWLHNAGLEDARDLAVNALLAGAAGQRQVLTTTISLLPAESSQQVTWDWAPPVAGDWQVRVEAGSESGSGGGLPTEVLVTADLYVQPQALPSSQWLLSLGSPSAPALLALLGGLALLASAAAALWTAGSRAEPLGARRIPESSPHDTESAR